MPFWDSIAVGQSIASESNFGDGFRDDFNTLDIETSSTPGNRTGKWKRGFMHANMAVNGFTYGSDEGGGDNFVHAEINRERQVYDDTRKPNPTGYSPLSIANGSLRIESRLVLPAEADWARVKGYEVNPDGTNGAFLRNLPAKYVSGMVSTYGRFAGSFMRLRAKVKTPYGAIGSSADINQRSAVFPAALWTLLDIPYGMDINGDPFGDGNTTYRPARPNGGGQLLELDADENFGESPTSVHQTTHYHPAGQSQGSSLLDASTIERVNDLRSAWRESGVDIFPDKIAFFIDGVYTKIVNTPDEIRNGMPIYEPIPGAEYDPVMVSANTAKVLGRQRHANGAIRYPCHVIIMNLARDGKYPRDLARQYFNSGILLPAHSNTVSMEIDWVEARPLIVDNPDMFPMRFNGVPTAADGSTGGVGGVDPGTAFTPRPRRTEPFLSYPVSAINGQTYTATADLPPNSDGSQPSPDDYTYLWSGGAGVTIVGSNANYSATYTMANVADNAIEGRTITCQVDKI